MRRSLIITLGIIVALLVLGGGVYFRSRLGENTTIPPDDSTSGGSLPRAGTGSGSGDSGDSGSTGGSLPGLKSLELADIIEYTVTTSSVILAVKSDGRVISASSTETVIGSQKVADVLGAWFSFDGKKLLLKAGDSLSPRWSVYDIKKNSWRQLSIEARDVVWSPGDHRVAYAAERVSGIAVSVLDLANDRSTPKILFNMNAEDLVVSWSAASRLFIAERPSTEVKGNAWTYDLGKNTLSIFAENARGLLTLWDGGEGLIFQAGASGRGGILSISTDDGKETQKFSFLTLPEKCAFYRETATSSASVSKKIVCAVPRDTRAFQGSSLPDDYYMRAIITADDFYSIDMEEGSFTSLKNEAARQLDAGRVKVYGNSVYFLNRGDKRLYYLPL